MVLWQDDISGAWKNDIGFLQTIGELSGLIVAFWFTGEPEAGWTSSTPAEHPCFSDDALRESLEGHCRSGTPGIFFENDRIFYGVMSTGSICFALGPAVVGVLSDGEAQAYLTSHGMEGRLSIAKTDIGTVTRYMKLMYYHFIGAPAVCDEVPISANGMEDWQPAAALEEYQLDQSENDRSHKKGVDFERNILLAVENGDIALMRKLMDALVPDVGEIVDFLNDHNKEMEYLAVSIITLMTRAAVSGGVRLELAHELGDVYLKKLGAAATRGDPVFGVCYDAMKEFVELVSRAKEEQSGLSYVEDCKDYIAKNLRKDLQVGDIAPAIGVSRTYLSRLFRQAEGITVQKYIQREKCRHAAHMLIYSDYSISQIAQYFGFSSQSYFGSCFQTWYGMTPGAYRKTNHRDFIHR